MAAFSHKDFINSLKGDTVAVRVGNKRKQTDVHRYLLASSCRFLQEHVSPYLDPDDDENPFEVHFVELDPDAFELFVNWLYHKTLAPLNTTNDDLAKTEVMKYIALYLMVEPWGILELKNLIIDTIEDRYTCDKGWFPRELIKQIWAKTPKGSPLRRYIVDYFLFKTSRVRWTKGERSEKLKMHLEYGNFDFVLECYEGLYTMVPKTKLRNRDPLWQDECTYHEHIGGEGCGA
ncbi:hypothetical protein MMC28_001305 [Mycoblastus sanguinarius]|nr:hypothetical protein [Mycoblastus sanguinarius]